jgi:oligopeptide/dipeptide ABC transporter ATP-binding protein
MRDLNLDPGRIFDVKTYQHELSGGQCQRILMALSLLLEPEVLILDEPTGALDLVTQRSILRLLHEIKEDYDLTLVFISHDLPIITGFADRLGIMYSFEFVELGATGDVMYDSAHPYTRGLLRSTPDLQTPLDAIAAIEGTSPDPVNIPSGCPYHPRCPIADDRCGIEKPEMTEMNDQEHRAACFYPDTAKEELPVTYSGDERR